MKPPQPRKARVKPAPSPTVDEHLGVLNSALDALTDAEPSLRPALEVLALTDRLEELLALLGRLHDAELLIKDMVRVTGEAAVAVVPSTREKFPIPGGGSFRVSQASPKKRMDNTGVTTAVAQAITDTLNLEAVVLPTGETGEPGRVIRGVVETVVKVCGANVPSFTGWRKTTLSELGVNLSRFTEFEDAPLRPVIEDRTS